MKLILILEYSIVLFIMFLSVNLSAIELDPGGNRVGEGLESYNQGEYQDSLRKYQEAESYFPEDSRLEFNRGTAEFKSGNLEKAIRHFEKSATSSSTDLQWKSRFNLGNSYMRVGDRKRAAEEYIKALKLNPDLKEARKNLEYLRHASPPSSPSGSNSIPQNQGQNPKNSQSPNGKQPQSKNDFSSGREGQEESVPDRSGKLTEEEAKRILDSLDLNKIRRKSRKSRDREVFW